MFERISRGIELTRQSWHVLREEKTLLVFPLFSGIACLLVLASFAVPLWATGYAQQVFGADDGRMPQDPLAYVLLFCFYFVNYFVVIFFNSALIHCALIRFHDDQHGHDEVAGDRPGGPQQTGRELAGAFGTRFDGLQNHAHRGGQQGPAGNLRQPAHRRTQAVGQGRVAAEGVGPITAIKRSFAILRKTWGESLTANFGIGLVVMLASLLAILPAVLGIMLGSVAAIVGIAITALLLIVISLVSTALQTIVLAALYFYAAKGEVPRQFDEQLLRAAYARK